MAGYRIFEGWMIVFLIAWSFPVSAVADDPPADVAGEAADQEVARPEPHAERMAPFVQAVRNAKVPSEASAAYARGRAIDGQYVPLLDAYLRKMLIFGLPKVAYYPAQSLVRIDPDHGLAWAVVGYHAGRDEDLSTALSYTVRAATLLPNNDGVLNNLGQLISWYESVLDLPDIPARDRRAMERLENDWVQNDAYLRAYRRIQDALREQQTLDQSLARRQVEVENRVLTLQNQALDLDAEIADVRQNIAESEQEILRLHSRFDYHYRIYPYYYPYRYPAYGGYLEYRYRPGYRYRRYDDLRDRELRDMIRAEQDVLDSLRNRKRALWREGQTIITELERKREELSELREKNRAINQRLMRRFRWDPPAVDGVIHDERDLWAPPPGPVRDVPVDAESLAAGKLNLAEMFRKADRPDNAEEILRQILEDYPDTAAGQKAKQRLGQE